MSQNNKVLVLGATGMLGNAVFRVFAGSQLFRTWGSARSGSLLRHLPAAHRAQVITGVDVEQFDHLTRLFALTQPAIVINCIGVVKQLAQANDPLAAIPINALLPHRLARLCEVAGARLVHVSTDCVFAGTKAMYTEDDFADADDLYGRSKYLGEVDYPNARHAAHVDHRTRARRRARAGRLVPGAGRQRARATRAPSSRACRRSNSLA